MTLLAIYKNPKTNNKNFPQLIYLTKVLLTPAGADVYTPAWEMG